RIYPPGSLRFKTKESINPVYLQSYIIATVDDKAAGRLCVYSNPYINIDGKPSLLIGNFECVHDDKVCHALIQHVEKIARQTGAGYIIGPV
ncbi:hypothetical protein OFC49_33685, partial [Escherichia coli]|nr:hypothetical protein [Escherichia coli]